MKQYTITLLDNTHEDGHAFPTVYYGTIDGAVKKAWQWFNQWKELGADVYAPIIQDSSGKYFNI
jgi:hypothetical protein